MGNFKYKKRDPEAVKARANQQGGGFDSFTDSNLPRFKITDGDTTIRILPPPEGIDEKRWGPNWGIELWLHNGIGSDKSAYLCHKRMNDEDCAICNALDELDPAENEKLLADAKAKKRILCWIVDRDDEKAGPQLMSMPWTLEKEISGRCIDKKSGAITYIDDPDEGYDVSFTRSKKGKEFSEYGGETIDRESSPLSDNAKTQARWLDFINENPLPDTLVFYDNDHLEKVFSGQKSRKDEAADEAENSDTKPTRRSSREAPVDREESSRPQRSTRPSRQEPEPEPETEKVDPNDINDMTKAQLIELCDTHDLEVDYKIKDLAKLRAVVSDALEEAGLLGSGVDDEIPSEGKRRAPAKDDERPSRARDAESRTGRSRGAAASSTEEEDNPDDGEDETAEAKAAMERLRKKRR